MKRKYSFRIICWWAAWEVGCASLWLMPSRGNGWKLDSQLGFMCESVSPKKGFWCFFRWDYGVGHWCFYPWWPCWGSPEGHAHDTLKSQQSIKMLRLPVALHPTCHLVWPQFIDYCDKSSKTEYLAVHIFHGEKLNLGEERCKQGVSFLLDITKGWFSVFLHTMWNITERKWDNIVPL